MTRSVLPSDPGADRTEQLTRQVRDAHFLLNQKIVQLETLYQAGLILGGSLDVEKIVGEFLLLAVSLVDARGGFLFLREERTRRLRLVQQANLDEGRLARLAQGPLFATLKRVIRAGAPLFLGPADLPGRLGIRYLLGVPVGKEGFIGLVDKETRRGVQAFSEGDGQLVELACRQAGAALANARLYRNIVEEKNLNQSIVRSIVNGVLSTDLQGRVVQFNPVVARLFADEGRITGKSCAQLFQRCGCSRIAAAIRAALADGQEHPVDAEPMGARGLSLKARIGPRRDAQGGVQGVVVALEDLTEPTRLRTLFKQYASDPVVELLLAAATPPALGGEQRTATMLFVDLVGSTELLGQMGAGEMVRLLNHCFTRLVDLLFDFNGTLVKYTGDGFLAVYGVPVAFADDGVRAARSALAIREAMAGFNRDHGLSWALKMGISQGEVVAGNIGSPRRMEYTVIGPDVSLAARLSDRARGGEILVSSKVYESLKEAFAFIPKGHQLFKGIREPLDVYLLVGPCGSRPRLPDKEERWPMEDRAARVDLNIPMIPDMELTATQTAEAVASFMKLDEDKIEEVKMALIEACINAIEHSQSKDGRLQIDFEITDHALTILIADRGQGFDVQGVREELRQRRESGDRQRGWGLRLMEEMMDQVDVQSDPNGTTITLVKYR